MKTHVYALTLLTALALVGLVLLAVTGRTPPAVLSYIVLTGVAALAGHAAGTAAATQPTSATITVPIPPNETEPGSTP